MAYDIPKFTFLNPSGLANLGTFSQVATVTGGKTVYISGQLAWDTNVKLVGPGDLKLQTEKVFDNMKIALASVGASFENVIKLTTYVVNLKPEDRAAIGEIRKRYFTSKDLPASTLVGVAALVLPDALIEVEAVAVVPL